mgnify:CR=1 FL=1
MNTVKFIVVVKLMVLEFVLCVDLEVEECFRICEDLNSLRFADFCDEFLNV